MRQKIKKIKVKVLKPWDIEGMSFIPGASPVFENPTKAIIREIDKSIQLGLILEINESQTNLF